MLDNETKEKLNAEIKDIIAKSRKQAVLAVNNGLVLMHWHIGERDFEEEQKGND